MQAISFVTLIYQENYAVLSQKIAFLKKQLLPSDEVIFVLNCRIEKKNLSFNWSKTSYTTKYVVPKELIKIAKAVNATLKV